MSKVVIAGGSGFLGGHVGSVLEANGHEVVVLSRSGDGGRFRGVKWDGQKVGDWAQELEGATGVINFCGASISKKWTLEYQRVLRDSRVLPTDAIGEAISKCSDAPKVWVNTSAVGYYGDTGDRSLSESSPVGTGFLAELSEEWENAVWDHKTPKTRKVIARQGIALGEEGALPILKRITEFFLGGPVGDGRQYMSWIHVQDAAEMYAWFLTEEVEGAVNVTSADPRTNAEFMAAMRQEIGRPPVPAAPAFALNLASSVLGIEPQTVLQGQRVYPVVAQSRGFEFKFPKLEGAIADLVGDKVSAK